MNFLYRSKNLLKEINIYLRICKEKVLLNIKSKYMNFLKIELGIVNVLNRKWKEEKIRLRRKKHVNKDIMEEEW